MRIGVLSESRPDERRVALVPAAVEPLLDRGAEVVVQSGAGRRASFTDGAYEEAGALVAEGPEAVIDGADVLLRVQAPASDEEGAGGEEGSDEIALLRSGQVLVAFLRPLDRPGTVRRLADAGVTAFAMELVPRITRAQKMDALSSQATVAGYKATLIGANALGRFLPMLMTAAGTIRPAKVLVLGAGVAGLQAIATARRLGAAVEAFDIRPAVKEQVESLGATFLEAELDEEAETAEGYARELSEEEQEDELRLIARHLPNADLVITTAQIPGREAPILITEDMVASMRPGSVVVDLASESGGNCALTETGRTVEREGIRILGPVNLPSDLPVHASQMYARNVSALLLDLVDDEGALALDFDDEVVDATCVTHDGRIRHAGVRERLEVR